MRTMKLTPWEEAMGPLLEISLIGDLLQARIGSATVTLPSEMECRLQKYIGHRISILRTDEDYLIRTLGEWEDDRR